MTDLSVSRAGAMNQQNSDHEQKLQQAAAQFEAIFINQLMKQGKAFGNDEGAIFGNSPAERNFQELLNNALSEGAAGGIGISDTILDQLRVHRQIDSQQVME